MKPASIFLLDQMFDRQVLATLRQETYDVVSVAEIGLATADDAELISVAITCIGEGITCKMLLDRAISER